MSVGLKSTEYFQAAKYSDTYINFIYFIHTKLMYEENVFPEKRGAILL